MLWASKLSLQKKITFQKSLVRITGRIP